MRRPRKLKGHGDRQGVRRKRSLSQGRRKPDLRVARRYGHDTGRGTSSPRREYPALGRHGDAACGGLRAASAMPESRVAPNVAIYHGSVGAFAHIACESAFPDARSIAGDSLLDVVDAVFDIAEIREDEIDARLVLLGEEHTAVNDEQLAIQLENGHVAADLAQTPQGSDAHGAISEGAGGLQRGKVRHAGILPRMPGLSIDTV